MSRARRAADRIREQVSLTQVLYDYGYEVDPRDDEREQQFSCDLHGDGQDNKPSARAYPDNGQFFCFACARSRDAITLVREKEGVDFWVAVKKLESAYGLPPLPWEPGDDERPPTAKQQIEDALRASSDPEQDLKRLSRFLTGLTRDRSLSPESTARLWEAHDRVDSMYYADELTDEQASSLSGKVLRKAKEALRAVAEGTNGLS